MKGWKVFCFVVIVAFLSSCGGRNEGSEFILHAQAKDVVEQTNTETPEPVNNGKLSKLFPDTVFLSGPTTEKKVALTFDDGPDPRVTGFLLDVLKEENVPATFFLMGVRVDAYPDLAKRISDEGHSIGSHGYWHTPIINLTDKQATYDLEKAKQAITHAVGQDTNLFRPPFGLLNEQKVELLKELNYSVILWSVDSEDWKMPSPDEMANDVIENVKPGSIILHHDGANWNIDLSGTVTAVKKEIEELKKQGYTFVTVQELLGL